MRTLRYALWVAVALVLFGLGALAAGGFGARGLALLRGQTPEAGMTADAPLGGAFTLVDQKGQPVTEAIFRGKPTAAFFGYTHCPDVCPTTLMEMSDWIGALGPDADKLRFVFVTVDPERDTPDVLNDYVSAFSNKIVGVTGEPEEVHAMVKDYKIVSRKVPLEGGDYAMDHTASVLLLDENGGLVGTIAREEDRGVALEKLRRLAAG
jgi:protein SCO1/2